MTSWKLTNEYPLKIINTSFLHIYTIFDLFCEKLFLRSISHQRRSPRYKMWSEVLFKQKISMIVCLLRIYQDDVSSLQYSVTLLHIEINDTVLVSCLIIDIIVCKDQKEKLQIIDKICYLLSMVVYIKFHRSLHSTHF